MNRRLLAALVAGTLFAAPATVRAQLKSSFSIAGGLSAPVSALANQTDAGYNLAAGLSFGAPLIPAGIRLELGYNRYNGRQPALPAATKVRIISGTVNGTLSLGPLGASPYLIAGVGAYNHGYTGTGIARSDRTTGGFNAGAGFRFPLGTISTFVEARYHQVLGNEADGTNLRFVPITFGINF